MLAIRDQENRIQSQQTVSANKGLVNGGINASHRTPGASKTPFKIPLNDENNQRRLDVGKAIGISERSTVKGNENFRLGGKQVEAGRDSFKTPIGRRAPLGQKTTNAKANTAYKTPGRIIEEDDIATVKRQSISARRKGLEVSHTEPVHANILSDRDIENDEDIGVIHSRPKDLSDTPDDLPEIDLTLLKGNFAATAFDYIYNEPGLNGPSLREKIQVKAAEELRAMEARDSAFVQRSIELHAVPPCLHVPLCPGVDCKNEPERRRSIEKRYQQKLNDIHNGTKTVLETKRKTSSTRAHLRPSVFPKPTGTLSRATTSVGRAGTNDLGPQSSFSVSAAAKLSGTSLSHEHQSIRTQSYQGQRPAPSKSIAASKSRNSVARKVSNTTIGYAQSRAMSGIKRRDILPRSNNDTFLGPAIHISSTESEDESKSAQDGMFSRLLIEDALDDFRLEMPEE